MLTDEAINAILEDAAHFGAGSWGYTPATRVWSLGSSVDLYRGEGGLVVREVETDVEIVAGSAQELREIATLVAKAELAGISCPLSYKAA